MLRHHINSELSSLGDLNSGRSTDRATTAAARARHLILAFKIFALLLFYHTLLAFCSEPQEPNNLLNFFYMNKSQNLK